MNVTAGVISISIHWNEVDCVERNGVITGYSVRYGLFLAPQEKNITMDENREFSIDRLLIRTKYSFEVAAINGDGVGAYSSVVNVTTAVPTGMLTLIVT